MRRDAVTAARKRSTLNCQNRVSCHLGEHDSSKSLTKQDTLPGLLHSKNLNIAESGVSQIINAYEDVIL
ncbi:hypothetical protein GJ496_007673 [Pomphorhynchus laevis]|nr:hypothetical protein GJ496_007673 [Pomphorhynchus laevis]